MKAGEVSEWEQTQDAAQNVAILSQLSALCCV